MNTNNNERLIDRVCQCCGKTFQRNAAVLKQAGGLYCTYKCEGEAQSTARAAAREAAKHIAATSASAPSDPTPHIVDQLLALLASAPYPLASDEPGAEPLSYCIFMHPEGDNGPEPEQEAPKGKWALEEIMRMVRSDRGPLSFNRIQRPPISETQRKQMQELLDKAGKRKATESNEKPKDKPTRAPDDGGPAFPQKEPLTSDHAGMSMRAYYAGEAMKGYLAAGKASDPSIAGKSVVMADALLAALKGFD